MLLKPILTVTLFPKVIMGGGLQELDGDVIDKPGDPVERSECIRRDGKKLWKQWLDSKIESGKTAAFVNDTSSLREVDTNSTDFLMGKKLFCLAYNFH